MYSIFRILHITVGRQLRLVELDESSKFVEQRYKVKVVNTCIKITEIIKKSQESRLLAMIDTVGWVQLPGDENTSESCSWTKWWWLQMMWWIVTITYACILAVYSMVRIAKSQLAECVYAKRKVDKLMSRDSSALWSRRRRIDAAVAEGAVSTAESFLASYTVLLSQI